MERPKLQAVARVAGVSVSTVSKVLNGRPDVAPATRTRVAELLGRAGYPDVGGRGGRGGGRGRAGELVEVVVNRLDDSSTSKLLRAVCLEAHHRGTGVVVTDVEAAEGRVGHPPRSWLDALDARGAKAVIGLLVEFSQAQLSYFEFQGIPACVLRTDEGDLDRVAAGHVLDPGAREPDWPVTTAVQPLDVMARLALDSVSAGQVGNTVVTVPPRLVDRGSTAPSRLPR